MDFNHLKNKLKSSPAYLIDESQILQNLTDLADLKKQSGCRVLYSIKALPLSFVMDLTKSYLDGLSVSSLYEARLAKEILGDEGSIHITTPGLRDNEFDEITAFCSHVSFNSTSQYQRLKKNNQQSSLGLRINPKLSFSSDFRFDPCRPFSKLGVDISSIDLIPDDIKGIHIHTVFSSTNYQPLIETVNQIINKLGKKLAQLQWINLGGGYLYSNIDDHQPFIQLVKQLKDNYDIEVYIEPGKAVVDNAGYLVTTLIDQFISDGKNIAVLDTSVNHHPEVFEYQKSPQLLEADDNAKNSCLLVGSSCLAGDVFGEYTFKTRPKVGDRLVFSKVGAYSLIKANRFNGYNLPDVYRIDKQQNLTLIKQHTYNDYQQQWMN